MKKTIIVLWLFVILASSITAGCEAYLFTRPIYPTNLTPEEKTKKQETEIERQTREAQEALEDYRKNRGRASGPVTSVFTIRR